MNEDKSIAIVETSRANIITVQSFDETVKSLSVKWDTTAQP